MRGTGQALLPLIRRSAGIIALTILYVVAARLGLRAALVHPSATAVWAPTGIALAALLIFGNRVWPAIFVGAFLANLATAGTVSTSLGIAAGNTLEAVTGAWLLRAYGGGRYALQEPRGVLALAVLAAGVSTTLSATIGVASLELGGLLAAGKAGSVWLTWWLGNAAGDLVVAPFLLAWGTRHDLHGRWTDAVEAAAMFAALGAAAAIAFGGMVAPLPNSPLKFLCLPPLVWLSYRFGRRGAATGVILVAAAGVWGTLRALNDFALPPNESLLLLQAYLAAVAVTCLTLAAVVGQRRSAEAELRRLAVSDGLTGLANYRRLCAVIEYELDRSERTARPFSILFFDVDQLKAINDRHGHEVGNRALRRVADALRATCRATDTPARYGGDEFAAVLPETEESDALEVARRVAAALAAADEQPPVSVSVGIAEAPRDGTTLGALLARADHAQYAMKARTPGWSRRPNSSGQRRIVNGEP